MAKLKVRNRTRDIVIADCADIADTSANRRTGQLKHTSLGPGEGLWIAPCEAVHTVGMKFAIDVIILNKKKKILEVRRSMPKWRISASPLAYSRKAFARLDHGLFR